MVHHYGNRTWINVPQKPPAWLPHPWWIAMATRWLEDDTSFDATFQFGWEHEPLYDVFWWHCCLPVWHMRWLQKFLWKVYLAILAFSAGTHFINVVWLGLGNGLQYVLNVITHLWIDFIAIQHYLWDFLRDVSHFRLFVVTYHLTWGCFKNTSS